MRVIGGEFRSRVLKSVPGLDTRPTPDRLREALFNVLAPRIAGTVFAGGAPLASCAQYCSAQFLPGIAKKMEYTFPQVSAP